MRFVWFDLNFFLSFSKFHPNRRCSTILPKSMILVYQYICKLVFVTLVAQFAAPTFLRGPICLEPMVKNKQPGDPSASLLLTSEKAVFCNCVFSVVLCSPFCEICSHSLAQNLLLSSFDKLGLKRRIIYYHQG